MRGQRIYMVKSGLKKRNLTELTDGRDVMVFHVNPWA